MTTSLEEAPATSKIEHATVPINTLYYACKVRAKLDPERVSFIEEQILQHDPAVRPILVAETPENPSGRYAVIDGRHRLAAYLNQGYETVPVLISQEHDPVEWMRLAAATNLIGGPQLPMNLDDIRQAIRNFVDAGKSDNWIRTALREYLPIKTISTATQWARSNRTKGLIRKAATYRDENDCSYAEAAAKFDVSENALKTFVQQQRKSVTYKNVELAKELTSMNQTYGNSLAAFFVRVAEAYRDGLIKEDEAKAHQARVSEYRRRIEAQCVTFLHRLDKEA